MLLFLPLLFNYRFDTAAQHTLTLFQQIIEGLRLEADGLFDHLVGFRLGLRPAFAS